MPILATVVETRPHVAKAVVPVEDRRFEFESLDGANLIDWSGSEFIDQAGITGIDMPPREVIRDQIPRLPGSRLQEIRDLEREVFLPVSVRPADRDYRSMLKQLASLRSFMDYRAMDYVAAEGTFDLAGYSTAGRRTLRCTYLDGMEGDYGADSFFAWWRKLGLRFLVCDPYWHGEQWSTPWVGLPTPRPFLSSNSAAHPWGLSASVALGKDMPVTVAGDVPSPATIQLLGGAASLHVTSPQGLDVLVGATGPADQLTIDTGRRKQVLLNGQPAWNLLVGTPQWEWLPVGDASISVEVVGATAATVARVFGDSLWETWC